MNNKEFLIIKPDNLETLLEQSYFKDYSVFTTMDGLDDGTGNGGEIIEDYKTVIDLNSKKTGLYDLLDDTKHWSDEIAYAETEYNYVQFDYNKIFVDYKFKNITDYEKAEFVEKEEKILVFLKELFTRQLKGASEENKKQCKKLSKNDIMKHGISLNKLIDKKYEKQIILVPTIEYIEEDDKKMFITLEELEIVKNIHLEALALLT